MAKFINQNSFFIFGGLLLGILAVILFRKGIRVPQTASFAAALLLLAGIWLYLRPQQTQGESVESVQQLIGSGTPLLLEFQSPF